jgi:acyl-CoA reductase-like NAD-dependent aldehyde dehydrogenase
MKRSSLNSLVDMAFDTEEDAIAIANDNTYGLHQLHPKQVIQKATRRACGLFWHGRHQRQRSALGRRLAVKQSGNGARRWQMGLGRAGSGAQRKRTKTPTQLSLSR